MPQIYNRIPTPPSQRPRRSPSVSSASSSSSSLLGRAPRTDADDSIVLSDLVRTGEASRLRRRGAMRLDHGHHNALNTSGYIYNAPRETSPTPWDSDDEPGVVTYGAYPHRHRRHSTRRRRHEDEESGSEEYEYTLVCGGEIPRQTGAEADEPWSPSILPIPPATSSSNPKNPTPRQTNGCGAIIHLRAAPRPRVYMWAARTAASSCVVSLDAQYFDAKEAAKFERSSCGCVKEGVGCAVCGNPLGTRYIPCRMAASGMFSPGHKHHTSLQAPWTAYAPPLCPEGPRYWHASPSSAASSSSTSPQPGPRAPPPASTFHVYSFFSTAVTSYPQYTFPSKPAPPTQQNDSVATTTNNPQESSTIYFDRHITSSPSPLEPPTSRTPEPNSWGWGSRTPNPYTNQEPNGWGSRTPNPYTNQESNGWGSRTPNPYLSPAFDTWGSRTPNPYANQEPNSWGPGGRTPNPYTSQEPNSWGSRTPNPFSNQEPNSWGSRTTNPYTNQEPDSWGSQSPNPYRTNEPTPLQIQGFSQPSTTSSFYQQTTPPNFYQQQILTAWDRERDAQRGPRVGHRRRETWNGFENENEQAGEGDGNEVWGGLVNDSGVPATGSGEPMTVGNGSMYGSGGPVSSFDGWLGIDEEDLQWRGEGRAYDYEGSADVDEEGVDKAGEGDGMWLER